LASAAAILLAGVVYIATDNGVMKIETNVDDVQVVLSKGGVEFEVIDLKTYSKVQRLPSGEYKVTLKGNTTGVVFQDGFTMTRWGQVTVKVTRAPEVAAVIPDPARPGGLRRFEGHQSPIKAVAYSPDGRFVLSGSGYQAGRDFSVRLWDVSTGKEVHRLEGHAAPVMSVAFSSDGSRIASSDAGQTIRIWETATGKLLKSWTTPNQTWVNSVVFSPDGHRLLSGGDINPRHVRLWDVASGEEIRGFEGHRSFVCSVAMSRDGKLALSGGKDQVVILWDVESGKEIKRLLGHSGLVEAVAFAPNGRRAISSGADKTIRLWDLEKGMEIRRFDGHGDKIWNVAFSPDGQHILSGSWDTTVRLWDAETGEHLSSLIGHTAPVTSVAFSPDGRQAVSAGLDKTLRLWRLPEPQRKTAAAPTRSAAIASTPRKIQDINNQTQIRSLAFSPDGNTLIAGGDDAIRVFDLRNGEELYKHGIPSNIVAHLSLAPEAAAFALKGHIVVVDLINRKKIHDVAIESSSSFSFSIALAPDVKTVVYQADGGMRFHDLTSGKTEAGPNFGKAFISGLRFTPDGRHLLGFGPSGKLLVLDAMTRKVVSETELGSPGLTDLSGDGKRLAAVCARDNKPLFTVFNFHEGVLERMVERSPPGVAGSLSLSPDGTHLALGLLNGTVQIWDLSKTEAAASWAPAASGPFVYTAVAFSPDGKRLAAGSASKITIWELTPP
jgi:WD40 repeat protein